jgi:hypothetical protein
LAQDIFDRLLGELEAHEQPAGLNMAELLGLPEPLGPLLSWMLRQGQVTLAEISAHLQQDELRARELMTALVEKGYVMESDDASVCEAHSADTTLSEDTTSSADTTSSTKHYRVRLAAKRGRGLAASL